MGTTNTGTYHGCVYTLKDALLLIEGVRVGRLPSTKRRLNDRERSLIRPSIVYVWNETECGLKRWTDGKIWSASKASGPFLIYTELDKKNDATPKPGGLIKQSFSLNTKQNQRYHLIAYMSSSDEDDENGTVTPSVTPGLADLPLSAHVYHENILLYMYAGAAPPSVATSLAANSTGSPDFTNGASAVSGAAAAAGGAAGGIGSSFPAVGPYLVAPGAAAPPLTYAPAVVNGMVFAPKPSLHHVLGASPVRRYTEDDERMLHTLNCNFERSHRK